MLFCQLTENDPLPSSSLLCLPPRGYTYVMKFAISLKSLNVCSYQLNFKNNGRVSYAQ